MPAETERLSVSIKLNRGKYVSPSPIDALLLFAVPTITLIRAPCIKVWLKTVPTVKNKIRDMIIFLIKRFDCSGTKLLNFVCFFRNYPIDQVERRPSH